jgi:hypothetical protein
MDQTYEVLKRRLAAEAKKEKKGFILPDKELKALMQKDADPVKAQKGIWLRL